MNTLRHDRNNLANITHTQLITAILSSAKKNQFFAARDTSLTISIDAIISDTIENLKKNFMSPILTNASSMRTATVHFNEKTEKEFHRLIIQLYQAIQTQFEQEMSAKNYQPATYLKKGLVSLHELKKQSAMHKNDPNKLIGLPYAFWPQTSLQSKKLKLVQTEEDIESALFRLSRTTLNISGIDTIPQQVMQSLTTLSHIDRCKKQSRGQEDVAEELHEELTELLSTSLQDQSSEFVSLENFLQEETVGQFKKIASLCSLRFFYAQYTNKHISLGEPFKKRWQRLEQFIERLQKLDEFIWHSAPNESFYDGDYQQIRFNFRELYVRADSLSKLPIIALLEGSLGETSSRDQGTNSFHFGVKLKMGGRVSGRKQIPTGMNSETQFDVFNYQVNLLDSQNQSHKKGMSGKKVQSYVDKIMTVLLTYYFVFKDNDDSLAPGTFFDPKEHFITHILPIFTQPDEEKKIQFLAKFAAEMRQSSNAKTMVTDLQSLFRALLKQKHLFLPQKYSFDLRVRNGLLEQRLTHVRDNRSFFQPKIFEGKNRKALKYITIEPDSVKADAFCKLNAKIEMEDILFVPSSENAESYEMYYDLGKTVVLPTFILPAHDHVRVIHKQYMDHQWRILFPYNLARLSEEQWNSDSGYIYRTSHALLSFLCLSLLLQYITTDSVPSKDIFLAIFRIHMQKEDVSFQETFMGDLSRVLAHIFAETYQAEHQGLFIGDLSQEIRSKEAKHKEKQESKPFTYPPLPSYISGRMNNVHSSLFSKIARTAFIPHRENNPLHLKKFVLMAVSGRESDAAWNDPEYKHLTMYGEIVTFDALDAHKVRIEAKKNFAYNIDSEKAYNAPSILADLTGELYQQGYHHILYLAHSPHTSILRIPHQSGMPFKENRYFMEEDVLRTMKEEKPELIIYPVFFDTFYVNSMLTKMQNDSFYIRDMGILSKILQDPSQRIIPFFYLFNGITIGDNEKYRGVTAYSTFLNFYNNDIVSNEHIHLGLLYEDGPLRRDILTYMTLFHFLRNEKSDKQKVFRRDPYRAIIGDESVGHHALYAHGKKDEGTEFNMLSFLTEVRKIIKPHQL